MAVRSELFYKSPMDRSAHLGTHGRAVEGSAPGRLESASGAGGKFYVFKDLGKAAAGQVTVSLVHCSIEPDQSQAVTIASKCAEVPLASFMS